MTMLNLSRSIGGVRNTHLIPWNTDFTRLVKELSTYQVGEKGGSYFIRCDGGSVRNDDHIQTQTANLLILDGDSRITEDGEIISGAPDPKQVSAVLTKLGVQHCIYSSHSNGLKGEGFHKYRVIMPCQYNSTQLLALLDWMHSKLHESGVMLYNVKENKAWSQPWYFPRVDLDREHLFRFYESDGQPLNVEAVCAEYYERVAADKASNPKIHAAEPAPAFRHQQHTYDGLLINPIVLFNNHWQDPFMYLQTQGYKCEITPVGPRMLRPGSESKTPGVSFCTKCKDGVFRVYSFGGDALNDGYAHDAFDCFRLLECGGDFNQALRVVGNTFYINNLTLEQHNRREYMKQQADKQASVNIDWSTFLGRSV